MLRNQREVRQEFEYWKENLAEVSELLNQLQNLENDEEQMTDAFYKDLEFGTGGIRGIMGIGTNRMNIYTVSRASKGVAAYIEKNFSEGKRSIAIGYDSRIDSEVFARRAAEIFASEGIRVYIYPTLMPTPMISWAVRILKCSTGIVITASHNPLEYNGYKVYAEDGCQITTGAAKAIFEEIESFKYFDKVKGMTFGEGVSSGIISFIQDYVVDGFIEAVKHQSLLRRDMDDMDKDISVVYTPLNGAGLKPITRVLKETGFKNVFVVPEQELPDGYFPTCPIPNPEEPEALELGLQYARSRFADILIVTDPDCDRVGVAVQDGKRSYVRLSANEIGVLLLDYICRKRVENESMPENPVFIKSVVTTDLAAKVAKNYGVRVIDVPTGFKFIGEQIGELEKRGEGDSFVFGFEESCGYLSGDYVRDKDGVGATLLICEMAAYYKKRGKSLMYLLEEIYQKYGVYQNLLLAYEFDGAEGLRRIEKIMEEFRGLGKSLSEGNQKVLSKPMREFWEKSVLCVDDYITQYRYRRGEPPERVLDFPCVNLLKIHFDHNCSVIIRPSGTEPKLKIYISADEGYQNVMESMKEMFDGVCLAQNRKL